MLSNGADLHTVQRLLGHLDVRVTLRYLHLIPGQLKERMELFSPLNGLVSKGEGWSRRNLIALTLNSASNGDLSPPVVV